ncbi:22844_t:CDS:2 [Cetraspora pellucida]|uniref:22844_t:CDS:1 n=1 Tax=Cetraspora pellucida TaxID=1433469 RepID=A0A9N8ZJG7_9GLOM|nr:22844_t:CDS:2 [Cetraspora pellucida]
MIFGETSCGLPWFSGFSGHSAFLVKFFVVSLGFLTIFGEISCGLPAFLVFQ